MKKSLMYLSLLVAFFALTAVQARANGPDPMPCAPDGSDSRPECHTGTGGGGGWEVSKSARVNGHESTNSSAATEPRRMPHIAITMFGRTISF
jgi:hypothetical protein